MQSYIETFREALARTDGLAGGMSNYPLQIDPGLTIDMTVVVAAIAEDFAGFIPHTDLLPGGCFRIARDLSYILFNLGVRHTITVGDIELVDGRYVGLSLENLMRDVAAGYQVDFVDGVPAGKPIEAHAWITLENGMVIDATILASQHRKCAYPTAPLPFEDAVFYTGKPNTPIIRHIPMMTGLVYHQKVLTSLMDGDLQIYCQWYEDYAKLMARLDLLRLVPVLTSR